MIIYLSGPISSCLDTYRETFGKAHRLLTDNGHTVISPHFLPLGLNKYQDYMNIAHECVKAAEVILLLPGWEDSKGAKTELKWAMDMEKNIVVSTDPKSLKKLQA